MENTTKWKQKPMKEGMSLNHNKYKMKKLKMKKDMNYANIETFIDILDDIQPDNEDSPIEHEKPIEGFVPTPIVGVGLDNETDYDGNDNIDKKQNNKDGGILNDYLKYLSYIFSYMYIFIRYLSYRISEIIYDTFSGNYSENFDTGGVSSGAGGVSSGAGGVSSGAGGVSSGAGKVSSGAGAVSSGPGGLYSGSNNQNEDDQTAQEIEEKAKVVSDIVDTIKATENAINENKENLNRISENGRRIKDRIDSMTYSERYFINAKNQLDAEINNRSKKRGIDVDIDNDEKGKDLKVISNNLLWLLSIFGGYSMSYTLYYYLFYSERVGIDKDIIDGDVTTILDKNDQGKIKDHHGNRVNFLPTYASVNKLAEEYLCHDTRDGANDDTLSSQLSNGIGIFFYKLLKPIVSLIELFHNFVFVYFPNIINGEHGLLGYVRLFPNIGAYPIIRNLMTNNMKFFLLTVLSSLLIFYSGKDFMDYIIGVLSGKPSANFFTAWISLLIAIVSFGLIYDSFKSASKLSGLTGLKERAVGKNITGEMATNAKESAMKNFNKVKESINKGMDNIKDVRQKIGMKGGDPEQVSNNDSEIETTKVCSDINENQGIFIDTIFGIEKMGGLAALFAYPTMIILNLIIFFVVLFTLFGFGPICIFGYILFVFGIGTILTSFDNNILYNINCALKLDRNQQIDLGIINKTIETSDLYKESKNNDLMKDAETYINNQMLNHSLLYKLGNVLSKRNVLLFVIISLFSSGSDIFINIKEDNVRQMLSIITFIGAGAIGFYNFMFTGEKEDIDFKKVLMKMGIPIDKFNVSGDKPSQEELKMSDTANEIVKNLTSVYKNSTDLSNVKRRFNEYKDDLNKLLNYMSEQSRSENTLVNALQSATNYLKNITSVTENAFILSIYRYIIKNKFGHFNPLYTDKVNYNFNYNTYALQTQYNVSL